MQITVSKNNANKKLFFFSKHDKGSRCTFPELLLGLAQDSPIVTHPVYKRRGSLNSRGFH